MTEPLGLNELLAAAPVPPGAEAYPSQIGITCDGDGCSTAALGDYVVHTGMTQNERYDVARRHLTDNEGWDCSTAGDFCPSCEAPTPDIHAEGCDCWSCTYE